MATIAYAVDGPEGQFYSKEITRRIIGEHDVGIDIIFSGICHSDIHQTRNEWGNSIYPMVPGHEILGRVTHVGSKVTKLKVGDLAGVGCFVDSCRECKHCKNHVEQFCVKGVAYTYNGVEMDKKTPTLGGYSTYIVVTESFVVKVSNKFTKLEGVAPLFCAGITSYSPLRAHQSKVGPGKKVGVVGLGGLGHMGVKFAVAMGAEVTVFSTSPSKEADAKKLGAKHFVVSKDENAFKELVGTFDLILDTVSANHDMICYVNSLAIHGVLAVVGAVVVPVPISTIGLIMGNKVVYGSAAGGIKETQEMIDFCAEHNIVSDVEVINADYIHKAYERTIKSDVKYRFVIDIKSLKK